MKYSDEQFGKWLDAYYDGSLSPEDFERFQTLIKTDPRARELFWQHAHWHAAFSQWARQKIGESIGETDPIRQVLPKPRPVRRWSPPRMTFWVPLAIAAALAVIFFRGGFGPSHDAGPMLAEVTYARDVRWGGTAANSGRLPSGDYHLEHGMVRLKTTAGAIVTMAAPASFRLVAEDRIDLKAGRLTARMLHDESRLTVKVADMEVRDLGTAFGVDATSGARTLVSVFDGLVAVTSRASNDVLRLSEGQSAINHRDPAAAATRVAAYDPETFRALWPLTVGVDESSKLVEFLPPGPLLRPLREYKANDRLFLFPEQQNVVNATPLMIDVSPEVRDWPIAPASPYPLPAGRRLNSYLVFFQPDAAVNGVRKLSGEITFQDEIVGIICSDESLDASDHELGAPTAHYETPGQRRGLEEADKENYRNANLPHDSISIEPDLHTVRFDFYVSDEREQIRVLVAAP